VLVCTLSKDFKAIKLIETKQNEWLEKRRKEKYSKVSNIEDQSVPESPRELPSFDNDSAMVWKRLKNDVMKPPFRPYIYAIFSGTGMQILWCWVILVIFYALNLLSNL
jgi:hypothetical protein